MNEDLKYRKAEPADAERIMEIIRQAQAQMRALGSRQWQDGYPARADIDNDIARGYGYVFEKSSTAQEPVAAETPQKYDKGTVPGGVIAYGGGGFRRRTGLRGNRRGVADRGRLRRPAPARWPTERRAAAWRRSSCAAPKRWPRTGRRQFQGGHQFRQPLHAADARKAEIRLLRQNHL